jgi:hypothetical protein
MHVHWHCNNLNTQVYLHIILYDNIQVLDKKLA